LILGACLVVYYRDRIDARDESGRRNVGLVVPLMNLYAYLLGAIVIAFPHWVAVGSTVAATLLLTNRKRLHDIARQIEIREIMIAAQFLILAGLILPLLPAEPVTPLTNITPRQAWLALVVVSGFSYVSYLVERYRRTGGLWLAALGGLYSSTATTVVLARRMKTSPATLRQDQAGIVLATGIMYIRILAVVAVFNLALARSLAPFALVLALSASVIALLQYRRREHGSESENVQPTDRNPLELGPALAFTATFIGVSVASRWVESHFGSTGIYTFAAVLGVADVDPFVLNLAQGGTGGLSSNAVTAAILIAASSNNLLKAVYTVAFAGRRAAGPCVVSLGALAVAGLVAARAIAGR
jgi:uncharacterized membrane protein (DUF4010 family)